ncbi:hypothetical protein NMG60_11028186 [Bertholletia excelsa]
MTTNVSNFSDMIQRVTTSCLRHPLAAGRHDADEVLENNFGDVSEDDRYKTEEDDEDEEKEGTRVWDGEGDGMGKRKRVTEMEVLMSEVFEAVSAMKRAYASLQEAHCPWDPDKMRVADVAVLARLRVLREGFRRSFGRECSGGRGMRRAAGTGTTLLEVATPYKAAMEDLKREVMAKEADVEDLREKLKTATALNGSGSGRQGRSHHSNRKVSCSIAQGCCWIATEMFNELLMKP